VNNSDCVLTNVEFHDNSASEDGRAGYFHGDVLADGVLCVGNQAGVTVAHSRSNVPSTRSATAAS